MIKKAVILFALVLLMSGLVKGEEIEIGRIDYEQKDWIVAEGNLSLSFNWSTRDNQNDLVILKILYEPTYNLSIFRVESKTITYDYAFINDTKYYHFNNTVNGTNDTNDYIIKIDFSSVIVPISPINQLREQIESMNCTINILISQLENMTHNYTTLQNESDDLSTVYNNQQELLDELLLYKSETSDYNTIKEERDNFSDDNDQLKSLNQNLQDSIRDRDKTISDLENPFGLFYSKGDVNLTQYNIVWMLFGAIFGLVLYFLFRSRYYSGFSKTLIRSEQGAVSKLLGRKEEKPEPVVWEDKPDVEKQILTPLPKEEEGDIAEEVDKVIKQSLEREIDSVLYG